MPDASALAERVLEGDLRLYELEEHVDAETAATARRIILERETGVAMDVSADYAFDAADADANVENLVGGTQLPLGVAGPIAIAGEAAPGGDDETDAGGATTERFLPLATTEGALVASVNRGCAVIAAAGGANARVTKSGMTRAPVFRVADVTEGAEVSRWAEDNFDRLAEAAESTTSHGELQGVTPYVVGDNVFLRFSYDTKDAMGMNMATIATEAASEVIEAETPAELVALSGNMCADKKPAAINAIEGRGRTVTADVTIPNDVVRDRLNVEPEAMAEANERKNLIGSAKAASLGFNAHAANIVAAIFLATGQDAAHVVEGSNAITTMEARDGELYASVSLASCQVGTVGGGTGLPTQAEALELLGVAGGGDPPGTNADALAEIVAAGALAGELSLIAAQASRHLASAHEELGR